MCFKEKYEIIDIPMKNSNMWSTIENNKGEKRPVQLKSIYIYLFMLLKKINKNFLEIVPGK